MSLLQVALLPCCYELCLFNRMEAEETWIWGELVVTRYAFRCQASQLAPQEVEMESLLPEGLAGLFIGRSLTN